MDLREIMAGVLMATIAIMFSLQVYPTIHNAVYSMSGNTTPLSSGETALLNLIPFVFCAAIVLIPVALLYVLLKE